MSDSAVILLNGVARGFRDSIVGMVRVYQMDRQLTDEVDSGEGSAGEETPTILARRRAARKKRIAASSSKDRFAVSVCMVCIAVVHQSSFISNTDCVLADTMS